jgi:DNA-binding GntR family transcriptional regulator
MARQPIIADEDQMFAGDAVPSLTTDKATEALRGLILSGELAPGSRLNQEDLAARFAVSRLPVRNALSRLESDGLVVLKPSSGAWVARLDLRECLEIYMIRERLEPLALSMAVAAISDAQVTQLVALVEAMAAGTDTETFLRLDRAFHLASYAPARMEHLLGLIERYWNTTQHYRRAFTKLLGRERNWIIHAEHRLIVDAIRRRDADGAAHQLCEHIRRTRLELAEHPSLFDEVAVKRTGPTRRPRRR